MKMANLILQGPLIVYSRNAIEFGLDRFQSFGLDLCFVHAGGVVVADLLFVITLVRANILRCGF